MHKVKNVNVIIKNILLSESTFLLPHHLWSVILLLSNHSDAVKEVSNTLQKNSLVTINKIE